MNEDTSEGQRQAVADEHRLEGENAGALSELVTLAEANRSVNLSKWPADISKEAERLLSEALFEETAGPDAVRSAIALTQDLPLVAVESAFAAHWPVLGPERKDLLLSELTKHNSSKWLTRQAAVAEKIARADQQAAAHILHSFVSGGKAGKDGEGFWPNLSKEKKELLQSRFLLSDGGWVSFEADDERVTRSLLAAFIEAADPQVFKKAKGTRPLYDFTKWAAATQKRLDLKEQARAEIKSRVVELANQLPSEEWKKEVRALLSADDVHVVRDGSRIEEARPVAPSGQSPTGAEQHAHEGEPVASPLTPPQELVRGTSRTLADMARESVALAERLADAVAVLEREKSELEAELHQTKKRNEGLQSDNAAREARLSAAEEAAERSRAAAESLGARLADVTSELERERAACADERRELEEEAARSAEVKLNGLRSKLGHSLRPVFENKKSTDDQEPSLRLAEFLRRRFDELEERLADAGITLRQGF